LREEINNHVQQGLAKSGLKFKSPTLGSDKIISEEIHKGDTRKIIPVATTHIGWEFKFLAAHMDRIAATNNYFT
jgi:hypothetical protein